MTYLIRVTCGDCTGTDPQGCFSGGYGYATVEDEEGIGYSVHDNPTEVGERYAAEFLTRDQAEHVLETMEQTIDWPAVWHGEIVPHIAP